MGQRITCLSRKMKLFLHGSLQIRLTTGKREMFERVFEILFGQGLPNELSAKSHLPTRTVIDDTPCDAHESFFGYLTLNAASARSCLRASEAAALEG